MPYAWRWHWSRAAWPCPRRLWAGECTSDVAKVQRLWSAWMPIAWPIKPWLPWLPSRRGPWPVAYFSCFCSVQLDTANVKFRLFSSFLFAMLARACCIIYNMVPSSNLHVTAAACRATPARPSSLPSGRGVSRIVFDPHLPYCNHPERAHDSSIPACSECHGAGYARIEEPRRVQAVRKADSRKWFTAARLSSACLWPARCVCSDSDIAPFLTPNSHGPYMPCSAQLARPRSPTVQASERSQGLGWVEHSHRESPGADQPRPRFSTQLLSRLKRHSRLHPRVKKGFAGSSRRTVASARFLWVFGREPVAIPRAFRMSAIGPVGM